MSTSTTGYLTPEETRRLEEQVYDMSFASSGAPPTQFYFLANFDGTNNDKNNLALSGSPYQTNVANIVH